MKQRFVRDHAIAVFCWMACVILGNAGCGPAPDTGPHVVLISIDTLRADHVGLYGYPRATTPNIDRFFGSRTVFEYAMSSAPCTVPSVRQLLAGAFDYRPDRKQLPEFLRDHDYTTAAIVSQHVFYLKPTDVYRRGFDHFDIQAREEIDHLGWTARNAEEVSDRALAWLKRNGRSERFFLWLHYFDPHDPYEPPGEFRSFDRGNRSSRSGDRRSYLKEAHRGKSTRRGKAQWGGSIFDDEDVAHFVNLYDGEVAYTDAQVGRVLDFLEENDLTRKSIVVLTSDHGEWLGENDRWDHCDTLRDVEIRVPLLLSVNGRPLDFEAASMPPASTLDILPTLLGLLDIEYPASSYHGEDLRRAASDRTVVAMWLGSRAIGNSEWKLLFEGASPAHLYRVGRDPEERWNRIQDEPEVVDLLKARMEPFAAITPDVRIQDDETVEQLEALGYLEP